LIACYFLAGSAVDNILINILEFQGALGCIYKYSFRARLASFEVVSGQHPYAIWVPKKDSIRHLTKTPMRSVNWPTDQMGINY